MIELKQKSLGSYKHFKIDKDRVNIETKNINKYEEYFVKFNTLGFDITRKKTKQVLILIPIYLVFTGLELYVLIDEYQKGTRFPQLLFWIFGVLLFSTGAVFSFFQKTDKVFIKGGSNTLELGGSNPDKETVDKFIGELHKAMRAFYKLKYALIDPSLDEEDQVQNYRWLLEINAISADEFEELMINLATRKLLR